MRDITLVVFTNDKTRQVFVTTAFYEEKFVQETFGQPNSKQKIEDFERTTSDNVVCIAFVEE